MGTHTSHSEILKRLKRASGHLSKVIEMIEHDSPCLEVAQQMHAVSSALCKAKQTYIHDHIEHCFNEELISNPRSAKTKIEEFKEITKYL
jgi:DNA-binding FrmR family transcriptional regulator